MDKFLLMLNEGKSVSDICKQTGFQVCHLCSKTNCCDNTNPLVKKIKELTMDTIPQPLKHFIVYGIFRKHKENDLTSDSSELVQLWTNEKDAVEAITQFKMNLSTYHWTLLILKVLQS